MAEVATVLNTDRLAGAFVALLKTTASPLQFFQMQITNAANGEGVCASHDFCDANMVMLEAFEAIAGREIDPGTMTDADRDAWSAAWNVARIEHLTDTTTTIATLTAEYAEWCAAEALVHIDAEELLLDDALSAEQRQWLGWFIQRWEVVQDAERLV